MTQIHFNRATHTATSPAAPWVTVHNDADPQFLMLRTLANMRFDGPWEAADEHGVRCWFGASVSKAARRYRPTAAEEADIAAKAKARKEAGR